ncbi:5-amino-6-(D-ribitylamino)uracil--L-tyrosine 4-hydroxyphenyl transferase CofH [Steroidobacter cummioxidans]|uniref:5-amino-6-(D-ribitylamino)uracil--L-tyrosine 4-hydroxyphenyl transferase CofH n=1 Tax=Steroidobacter cummioxidans TaxID=1803913 RepID=UPI000E3139E5|nr:5-amino-6-(D-ribitylamino)uracil--L-tyrosine 4-hydroxyphenyl transferase CofH [Steroidobacter cummioxidans]
MAFVSSVAGVLAAVGERATVEQALALLDVDWRLLAPAAADRRDAGFGSLITYSRKVFIPLTRLCRDVCHYCTFATTPRSLERAYLNIDEAVAIARAGASAACKEALFTLGDRPETRYSHARRALAELGHESTLSYLQEVATRVRAETGLLPHLNPGVMDETEFRTLRPVAPSMGLMLESASTRLSQRGGPHFGSPDKTPERRLASLRAAGVAKVPTTSGILIGIGETRRERVEALLALRDLHDEFGHLQEIIIQNFRAKPGTLMEDAPEPSMDELAWTVAMARLLFGPRMSIQVPPNLYVGDFTQLIDAGINDCGGISPVTPDHVNPEAPWPHVDRLAERLAQRGATLVERLTVYPQYIERREQWIDPALHAQVLRWSDGGGLARIGAWSPGGSDSPSEQELKELTGSPAPGGASSIVATVEALLGGVRVGDAAIAELFTARGADFLHVQSAADELRREQVGDEVTYVVNRNINYTNICLYRCTFCAFSKGRSHAALRGPAYVMDLEEIGRRADEAWQRGATEVCMQGGIHPSFDGNTYLEICRTVKRVQPDMHVHAFSPLEITHGARTLGITVGEFLSELRSAGLGSLPGTAAEILDDEVRRVIAPDKPNTDSWVEVMRTAHQLGLRSTATIMFGHIESYLHWARHLQRVRELQDETGGFTEFVPLPFVHMEAPMYLKGRARRGPTLRETILMHAISRLVLGSRIRNIQVSWVKLGPQWAQRCLLSGANDLGGTLMNESISKAAGAIHGQAFEAPRMAALIEQIDRRARRRTTLYGS